MDLHQRNIFSSVPLYTHVVPLRNRNFSGFVLPVRWDVHSLYQILHITNVKYILFLKYWNNFSQYDCNCNALFRSSEILWRAVPWEKAPIVQMSLFYSSLWWPVILLHNEACLCLTRKLPIVSLLIVSVPPHLDILNNYINAKTTTNANFRDLDLNFFFLTI